MENVVKWILEYLKVLLTAPTLFSVVAVICIFQFKEELQALLNRVANIKLPGGAEVSTPQSIRSTEETKPVPTSITDDNYQVTGLPSDLSKSQKKDIEKIIRSHVTNSYLWEYRYLNYFFVRSTQVLLDWLISLQEPTTYKYYDSFWLPLIPSAKERRAMIEVLEAHYLIEINGSGMILVTPKGKEYHEWRGELPPAKTSAREG